MQFMNDVPREIVMKLLLSLFVIDVLNSNLFISEETLKCIFNRGSKKSVIFRIEIAVRIEFLFVQIAIIYSENVAIKFFMTFGWIKNVLEPSFTNIFFISRTYINPMNR